MDLQRDMRKYYDVIHKITPKEERMTYWYFLKRKKWIKEYYDENRCLLLHNEQSLLERRNYLHTLLNSSTSPSSITMSIVCGVGASFCYSVINEMTELLVNNSSPIIGIFILLLVCLLLIILAGIVVFVVFKGFSNDKCLDDLHSFELLLIEDILNENYQPEKIDIKPKDEETSKTMEEINCKLINQCSQVGFWDRELGKILIFIFCMLCILAIISKMMNNWKILEFWSEIFGIVFFGYYARRYALAIYSGRKEDKKAKGEA